jgi:hypothetical protein
MEQAHPGPSVERGSDGGVPSIQVVPMALMKESGLGSGGQMFLQPACVKRQALYVYGMGKPTMLYGPMC